MNVKEKKVSVKLDDSGTVVNAISGYMTPRLDVEMRKKTVEGNWISKW